MTSAAHPREDDSGEALNDGAVTAITHSAAHVCEEGGEEGGGQTPEEPRDHIPGHTPYNPPAPFTKKAKPRKPLSLFV